MIDREEFVRFLELNGFFVIEKITSGLNNYQFLVNDLLKITIMNESIVIAPNSVVPKTIPFIIITPQDEIVKSQNSDKSFETNSLFAEIKEKFNINLI